MDSKEEEPKEKEKRKRRYFGLPAQAGKARNLSSIATTSPLLHLPKINPRGLLRNIHRCNRLPREQINDLDRSRLGSNSFHSHKSNPRIR
jgi:hypothetical protein